ncbi:MAG TPA: sugar phosphate isomerase/epimerase [Gaiellaceae bacterium]|nr:sugar phosphate isomerase/epimerase [Gaiellaceae bacterium]
MPRVGLQLWTVREECDRDLERALRTVAAQGYDGVELFQLHGHDAQQVRAWLDAAKLVAAGRHVRVEALESELPQLAEELRVLGTDRAAIAWIDPEELERPDEVAERVAEGARAAREHGIRLGFHNHWTEPVARDGGESFLDLLRRLPPDLLWLELDLGWVWQAGVDPVAELEKTAGRCPLVHAKDYRSRDGRDDVPVGEGVVGYDRVLPAALAAGVEWLIVEEDDAGDDAFAATQRSVDAVRRIVSAA